VKRASFNQEKEKMSVKKRRYDTVRTYTNEGRWSGEGAVGKG